MVASMALVGCAGLGEAGSAATVGDVQVSTQTLAAETAAIQVQRGGQSGAPDAELTLDESDLADHLGELVALIAATPEYQLR